MLRIYHLPSIKKITGEEVNPTINLVYKVRNSVNVFFQDIKHLLPILYLKPILNAKI